MDTIAFAGCTNHIGTTTQAMQLLLKLKAEEKRVCYLELNKTGYLNDMLAVCKEAINGIMSINYQDITHYKKSFLKAISYYDWDYVIRDYGNAGAPNFDEDSFSKQKTKILVCGSKPNEIFEVQKLLAKNIFLDSFFVFSFVPDDERVSIASLFGSKANIFFTNNTMNPYKLTMENTKLYERLLNK